MRKWLLHPVFLGWLFCLHKDRHWKLEILPNAKSTLGNASIRWNRPALKKDSLPRLRKARWLRFRISKGRWRT